jgi:hypothetical protein
MIFSYWKLLATGSILRYDDSVTYVPVAQTTSISEYIHQIKSGRIADIQPIRDFSYFIDGKIKAVFPNYSIQFSNLFWWIITIFLFFQLLSIFINDQVWIFLITLFYSFSPVVHSSIAWISGRKHILSTLFILLCAQYSYKTFKGKSLTYQKVIFISLFYLASILSQPINIFFPIWMFFLIYFIFPENFKAGLDKKLITLIICLSFIAMITAGLNYYYYKNIYSSITGGVQKILIPTDIHESLESQIGLAILALGRNFILPIYPMRALPSTHFAGSIDNLVGLFLLPLFFYGAFKIIKKEQRPILYLALIHFLYPLIPTTIFKTNIFVSDTYLLNSMIGLMIIVGLILINLKNQLYLKWIFSAYLIYTFIFNLSYINSFIDDYSLWSYSYDNEPTISSTLFLAENNTLNNNFQKADSLIKEAYLWDKNNLSISSIHAKNIYLNPNFSPINKIEFLKNIEAKGPTQQLFLTLLYAQLGDHQNVIKSLNTMTLLQEKNHIEMHDYLEHAYAFIEFTCRVEGIVNCDEIYLSRVKRTKKNWDQKKYLTASAFFKSRKNFSFIISL